MVYDNVKRIADERKIPIAKLERKADIANGTIGKWKTGMPRMDSLKKVADYLNVTVDELIKE